MELHEMSEDQFMIAYATQRRRVKHELGIMKKFEDEHDRRLQEKLDNMARGKVDDGNIGET